MKKINLMPETHNNQLLVSKIENFKSLYESSIEETLMVPVNFIMEVKDSPFENYDFSIVNKMPLGYDRYEPHFIDDKERLCYIKIIRKPFRSGYIEAILRSRYFFQSQEKYDGLSSILESDILKIPLATEEIQRTLETLMSLINNEKHKVTHLLYFLVILDVAIYQLYKPSICKENGVNIIEELQKDLAYQCSSTDYYKKWKNPESKIKLYTFRSKYLPDWDILTNKVILKE